MPVFAGMEDPHGRDIRIDPPGHNPGPDHGLIGEVPVLVLHPVIVASRQFRPHAERHPPVAGAGDRPPHDDKVAPVHSEDFLPDHDPVALECPGRPRVRREPGAAFVACRVDRARIEVGRQWPGDPVDLKPVLDLVDQNKPLARRLPGGEQERMVAAGIRAGDRARGKPSPAVRLEPFEAQGMIEITAILHREVHAAAKPLPSASRTADS